METMPNKALAPARIAAIVLIAIAVAGLAYIHFVHHSRSVSVPSGHTPASSP